MGTRILLVEDDQDLVITLRDVLEHEGCDVYSAGTGEAALEACDQGPTLALVDLHIEGRLTGAELIGRLRERLPAGARLFLLSGERDLPLRARELGADGWLEKPFGVEALLQVLRAEASHPSPQP